MSSSIIVVQPKGASVECVGKLPIRESRVNIRPREHNHSHHIVHISETKGSTGDEFDFIVGGLESCIGELKLSAGNWSKTGVDHMFDHSWNNFISGISAVGSAGGLGAQAGSGK